MVGNWAFSIACCSYHHSKGSIRIHTYIVAGVRAYIFKYIGITNNTTRRLRQHNKELVGGAKYTTINKGEGDWVFYGFIKNLNKILALSFEKKIKIKSRRMSGTPLEKRNKAITKVLEDYNIIFNTNYSFEIS